jgi:hypothetical protein
MEFRGRFLRLGFAFLELVFLRKWMQSSRLDRLRSGFGWNLNLRRFEVRGRLGDAAQRRVVVRQRAVGRQSATAELCARAQ